MKENALQISNFVNLKYLMENIKKKNLVAFLTLYKKYSWCLTEFNIEFFNSIINILFINFNIFL